MNKRRDITPIDFAINLDDLCILVKRDKKPKKRGYVSVKLCRGEYISTSDGINVLDEKVLYENRFSNFPNAMNDVSRFYASKREMSCRPIDFPKEEVFTRWILEGGSLGIYSYLAEEIPRKEIFLYQKDGLFDAEEVLKAFTGEVTTGRIFDSLDSELTSRYLIEEVINFGIYRISENRRIFGGMFNNGREVGFDIFSEDYVLSGEKSRGFIEALIKMDKELKTVIEK